MNAAWIKVGGRCIVALLMFTSKVAGQQTVFSLMKNDLELAQASYDQGNYREAIELFSRQERQGQGGKEIHVKLARCYYALKDFRAAAASYEKYQSLSGDLSLEDLYQYAEAECALSHYDQAISIFKTYLKRDPGNELVMMKVWRLDNRSALYEDSTHYSIKRLPFNTPAGELCLVRDRDELVFISNRTRGEWIERIDPNTQTSLYGFFQTKKIQDTTTVEVRYKTPVALKKVGNPKFNVGPIVFYQNYTKAVFASGSRKSPKSKGTLGLYFAERIAGEWTLTGEFSYNSDQYSISDPAISADGLHLYFSSDMKGGRGGRDLYRCDLVNSRWTRPVNLGDGINTLKDEVFPFLLKDQTLYFSSNGQPGLGGLDIFIAEQQGTGFAEPRNAGYPLNSSLDDFGITIDSTSSGGYFTSNRKNGGYDDDVYEFEMDLQTYPVVLTGVMKFKENTEADSADMVALIDSKFSLIDNARKVTVVESKTDAQGNFQITIPYFSNYLVRVVGSNGEEHIAVLSIPRYRKEFSSYEIVFVKDLYQPAR
jgi:tetratricopeptide (TPR) repeat protein